MSNAEQYWVYQQLEPNDLLRAGNAKRYKPVDWVQEFIAKFGLKAYQDRCREDMEKERRQLKY